MTWITAIWWLRHPWLSPRLPLAKVKLLSLWHWFLFSFLLFDLRTLSASLRTHNCGITTGWKGEKANVNEVRGGVLVWKHFLLLHWKVFFTGLFSKWQLTTLQMFDLNQHVQQRCVILTWTRRRWWRCWCWCWSGGTGGQMSKLHQSIGPGGRRAAVT